MGNAVSPACCFQNHANSSIKVVFWGGTTLTLHGNKHIGGEIMFKYPDYMVCPADSFFIGQPIPSLGIQDRLVPGQTYFMLPIDRFGSSILSISSLSSFASNPDKNKSAPVKFGECPFEYLKGSNGRVVIKVVPEFITRLIGSKEDGDKESGTSPSHGFLCSTPELKKHYDQLVGPKDQIWSPKLDTISEYKLRYSPCRFIGLEWKEKETDL